MPPNNPHVPIKDYVDLHAHYIFKAADVAERALSKRLDGMNEIRDQLTDQANRLATKDYTDGLEARLRVLEGGRQEGLGWRSGISPLVAIAASLISAIVGAFAMYTLTSHP